MVAMSASDLKSLTSGELDALVRVDDKPAAIALQKLYEINRSEIENFLSVYQNQGQQFIVINVFGLALLVILILYAVSNYTSQLKILKTSAREKESRLFLEEVLNSTNSTVIVSDRNGKIVEVNQSVKTLTGYSKPEILGESIELLVPEQSRKKHVALRENAIAEKATRQNQYYQGMDLKLRRKDGSEISVAISLSHITVNDESLAVTVVQDVTEERKTTRELQTSQKFLQQSQDVAQFSSWYWNTETGDVQWSESAIDIYGLDRNDLGHSFNSIVQFVHPEDKNFVVDAIQTTVVLKSEFSITYRLILPSGATRFIREEGKPFEDDSQHTFIIGTARDVTEEHLKTELLKMADSVFNNSQDGIVVVDAEQRILRINKAYTSITGFTEGDALGKTPEQLFENGKRDDELYARIGSALGSEGEWSGQLWEVNSNGHSYLSQQHVFMIIDEQTKEQTYVSIIRDITAAHQNEELMRKRAYFDGLTKLPNRMLFQDRLSEKLAKVRRGESRFALCFADLDGFKSINDTHGHEAGDLVLQTVSSRMVESTRDSDTVARLAGDEFTLILDEVSEMDTALLLANKIIATINEPIPFNGESLSVGASFGIIIVDKNAKDSFEELLGFADKAMYEAKQAGKNRAVIYHQSKLAT
jgi:diguanylate cyclase (GGDEF)-like protein/PAS domain S-box-containing protein